MTFDEFINLIKDEERTYLERLVVIVSNTQKQEGVIAWEQCNISVDDSKFEVTEGMSQNRMWEKAWDCCSYNLKEFIRALNVPTMEAEKIFHSLKQGKMIYPDGTINEQARKFIRQKLNEALVPSKRLQEAKDKIKDK